MRKFTVVFLCLFASLSVFAQRDKPGSETELKDISDRGKMLVEYDIAAWHSTDAVMELKPEKGSFEGYIARKEGSNWTVVYGKLSEKKDSYLIRYEAVQQQSPESFKIKQYEVPKEDKGFYLNAAKAVETAIVVFIPAEKRPYNKAILPTKAGEFFVYFMPAQTVNGVFPLGGDMRYKISRDGSKILESRQLHKAIIEFQTPKEGKVETGIHTAIMDDMPEDTDVFHVLVREPKVPELIATQKFVYLVQVDGSIRYLMTAEAFKKVGKDQSK